MPYHLCSRHERASDQSFFFQYFLKNKDIFNIMHQVCLTLQVKKSWLSLGWDFFVESYTLYGGDHCKCITN